MKSSFPTLQHNGTSIESSYDKAVLLNNFFFECFNKSVPPLSPDLPHLDPFLFPAELLCTEENILTLICSLDYTKSTGPDDISPRMLKGDSFCNCTCSHSAIQSLTFNWLFSRRLETCSSCSCPQILRPVLSNQLSTHLNFVNYQQNLRASCPHHNLPTSLSTSSVIG